MMDVNENTGGMPMPPGPPADVGGVTVTGTEHSIAGSELVIDNKIDPTSMEAVGQDFDGSFKPVGELFSETEKDLASEQVKPVGVDHLNEFEPFDPPVPAVAPGLDAMKQQLPTSTTEIVPPTKWLCKHGTDEMVIPADDELDARAKFNDRRGKHPNPSEVSVEAVR